MLHLLFPTEKSSLLLQARSAFLTERLENRGASMLKAAANKALTLSCNALQWSAQGLYRISFTVFLTCLFTVISTFTNLVILKKKNLNNERNLSSTSSHKVNHSES